MSLSSLIFGPIMSLGNIYFIIHFKAIASVCGVTGIRTESVNVPSIFLLIIFSIVSFCVTLTMVFLRSIKVLENLFVNSNSVFFRLTRSYILYN